MTRPSGNRCEIEYVWSKRWGGVSAAAAYSLSILVPLGRFTAKAESARLEFN